jgi:hypothetical protein
LLIGSVVCFPIDGSQRRSVRQLLHTDIGFGGMSGHPHHRILVSIIKNMVEEAVDSCQWSFR